MKPRGCTSGLDRTRVPAKATCHVSQLPIGLCPIDVAARRPQACRRPRTSSQAGRAGSPRRKTSPLKRCPQNEATAGKRERLRKRPAELRKGQPDHQWRSGPYRHTGSCKHHLDAKASGSSLGRHKSCGKGPWTSTWAQAKPFMGQSWTE